MPKQGAKRGSYKMRLETRGKTGRETHQQRSFWSNHTMEDMITLSPEELDNLLEEWFNKKFKLPIDNKTS